MHIPWLVNHPFSMMSSAPLAQLNWTRDETTTNLSIEGRKQLGIDVDGWPEALAEESLLAHVLMADDQEFIPPLMGEFKGYLVVLASW